MSTQFGAFLDFIFIKNIDFNSHLLNQLDPIYQEVLLAFSGY